MKLPPASKFIHAIILGGGTGGLLQAAVLNACGLNCYIFERRTALRQTTRVGLLQADALEMLQRLSLLDRVLAASRPVDRAAVRVAGHRAGEWSFASPHPGIPPAVTVSHAALEEILLAHLAAVAPETIFRSVVIELIENVGSTVRIRARFGVQPLELNAAFLIATDGPHSPGRQVMEQADELRSPGASFIAADFADGGGSGDNVLLAAGRGELVESLPLHGGLRRWVWQTPQLVKEADERLFLAAIQERTGMDLASRRQTIVAAQRVEGWLAGQLTRGRVLLAADAAYRLAPVAGGSLACACLDARDIGGIVQHAIQAKASPDTELASYARRVHERVADRIDRQRRALALAGSGESGLGRLLARVITRRLPGQNPAEFLYAP